MSQLSRKKVLWDLIYVHGLENIGLNVDQSGTNREVHFSPILEKENQDEKISLLISE